MDFKGIKYPIYIVSKGRWQNPLTAKFLMKEGIPFFIAVEPQEFENYCTTIPREYVLKLPFANLGLGSYPARNYCWDHAKANGYKKHFLFDDNIRQFKSLNKGLRRNCEAVPAIVCLQDFVERYTNVPIAGWNYSYFVTRDTNKPFFINTHVYSGLLIDNNCNYRWRLKYNEDVDICLQALDAGEATILLNAFLIEKMSTVTKMKGGNQDELYKNNSDDKKYLKASSLKKVWPQYVEVVQRFNRPHHYVNWKKHFKQPLKKKVLNG